ncbi:hypothetical protein ABEB36_007523 [Hypothenemus hampei]|uniref:Uncharacterized protein n=1 Tax=Hypothenemus hampei TaxID=57062 RepID=A0ABD1EV92_HYPHA
MKKSLEQQGWTNKSFSEKTTYVSQKHGRATCNARTFKEMVSAHKIKCFIHLWPFYRLIPQILQLHDKDIRMRLTGLDALRTITECYFTD